MKCSKLGTLKRALSKVRYEKIFASFKDRMRDTYVQSRLDRDKKYDFDKYMKPYI